MKRSAAALAAVAAAGFAHADVVDLVIFEIIATDLDSGVSETRTFTVDAGTNSADAIEWTLPDQVTFGDIGRLDEASISVNTNGGANRSGGTGQSVTADFSVFASTQNAGFQINSAVVSFSQIDAADALGFASAAIVLNDVLGDGATLTPGSGGGYNAIINGNTASPFATLFPAGAPLVGSGNFGDDSGSFLPTGTDVNSISVQWNFALSGFDSATGTSTFTVVPAPASAALLGLGGLAAARRRR
ncbi:MAG: PEP-CTERM sorting domain-containing protein [Planctomycetota bacterium]